MASTRTKLFIVAVGTFWCFILIFVASNFDSISNGKRSYGVKEPSFDALNNINIGKSSRLYNGFAHDHIKRVEELPESKIKRKHKYLFSKRNGKPPLSVVVTGNGKTIMGVVAAINSAHVNSNASLHFYVVLPEKLISHFKVWMKAAELAKIKYVVRSLPSIIPKANNHLAKLFISDVFPELNGNFVYLDSDVIVQGNIQELYGLHYKKDQLIFASNECTSLSKHKTGGHYYYSHLNMTHPQIKNLNISPLTCTFNPNVFVGNISEWRRRSIPKEFKRWFKLSKHGGPLHGVESNSDDAEAIMLLTFYQKIGHFDQLWHIGDLGSKPTSWLSSNVISKAKLLHWNGHYKPWSRIAAFKAHWEKYFVEDPQGKYAPMRRTI